MGYKEIFQPGFFLEAGFLVGGIKITRLMFWAGACFTPTVDSP
jgi:hypothetical protein